MSAKLDQLMGYFARNGGFDDLASADDVYAAQKQLEQKIVEEVCTERVDEIMARVEEKTKKEQARAQFEELRTTYVQCVILALLIGLLGSHLYDFIRCWLYGAQPDFVVTKFWVGLGVTVVICFIACCWMFFSVVMKVYNTLFGKEKQS